MAIENVFFASSLSVPASYFCFEAFKMQRCSSVLFGLEPVGKHEIEQASEEEHTVVLWRAQLSFKDIGNCVPHNLKFTPWIMEYFTLVSFLFFGYFPKFPKSHFHTKKQSSCSVGKDLSGRGERSWSSGRKFTLFLNSKAMFSNQRYGDHVSR